MTFDLLIESLKVSFRFVYGCCNTQISAVLNQLPPETQPPAVSVAIGQTIDSMYIGFYSDVLEEETAETMWAIIVDQEKGLYKLDSIPFYAPLIASNDIFFAEYDEKETMLTYRKTIEYSGNSTIWVVVMDNSVEVNEIRKNFENIGCVSEKMNDAYFTMEIPAIIDYKIIKKELEELEQKEIIGYSEPCLSNLHQY